MLLVKIRRWKPINDLEHIATTWEVATDVDFNNILESHPNSSMLELFFSAIEVPKDTTYYVRAKRHFSHSSIDYWLHPVTVTNMEESYSNMLLSIDSYIQQPYVYVNKDDIFSSSTTLTLKSSKFISNVDQHESTSWFVFDGRDNLLYSNLNNKTDLLEHTIPNLAIFKTKSNLKFMIVHRGVTGVESKAGFLNIKTGASQNFEITTSLNAVKPLEDLTIKFTPLRTGDRPNIVYVNLASYSNPEEVILPLPVTSLNTVTIPWFYLKPGMKYQLVILTYDSTGTQTRLTNSITVENITDFVIKDPEYKYTGKLDVIENSTRFPDNIMVDAMAGNLVLIPNVTYKKMIIYTWNETNGGLVSSGLFADGITLPNTDFTGLMVRPISKTLVVLDVFNENNVPTFLVYNYDMNSGKFTIKHTIPRTTETKCLGLTGAVVQSSSTELIYIPVGTTNLKKLNVITGEITSLTDIPLAGMTKGLLLRCKNNRIFIGNTVDFQAVVFNSSRLDYTAGYSFGPESFVNRDCKAIPLVNGNTMVFKSVLEDHKDGNFTMLDYNTGAFTYFKLSVGNYLPLSFITLNNGYVVMPIVVTANLADVKSVNKYQLLIFR